jgi:hypothetical protein
VQAERIQTGSTEPIIAMVLDQLGAPLTGKTDIVLSMRRQSDGKYLDWSDMRFKNGGPIVQLYQVMTEVNPTRSPGEYQLSLDTSAIVNAIDDDIYETRAEQLGGTDAGNLPQIGELKVDAWLQKISEGEQIVRDFGLDHLVSVNPGIVPPAANTYIRQILDKEDRLLIGGDVCVVKQSYAYDAVADKVTGQVWVEKNNQVATDALAVTVTWYNEDGTALFAMTDSAPDAQGVFKVSKQTPGLVRNRSYYMVALVNMATLGLITSAKGTFTIG